MISDHPLPYWKDGDLWMPYGGMTDAPPSIIQTANFFTSVPSPHTFGTGYAMCFFNFSQWLRDIRDGKEGAL